MGAKSRGLSHFSLFNPSGSVLAAENLDRPSCREPIDAIEMIIFRLIKRGITSDRKVLAIRATLFGAAV